MGVVITLLSSSKAWVGEGQGGAKTSMPANTSNAAPAVNHLRC